VDYMPIRIKTGGFNSGKTSIFIESMRATGSNFLYILPSDNVANDMWKFYSKPFRSVVGNKFISWNNFVYSVARPDCFIIPNKYVAFLLMDILPELSLSRFNSSNPSLGLCREIANTIAALKKNGVTPSRLKNILVTRGGVNESDLLKVFELYSGKMSRDGMFDESDIIDIAIDKLSKNECDFLEGIDEIFIDEFYRLTPMHLRMLEAVNQFDPKCVINIALPSFEGFDLPYSQVFSSNLQGISKIAERVDVIQNDSVNHFVNDVRIVEARSPVQQSRMMLDIIMRYNEIGRNRDEIAVLVPSGSDFERNFEMEVRSCGLWNANLVMPDPIDVPIVNELFSVKGVANLPEDGTISLYASICSEYINEHAGLLEYDKNDFAPYASRVFRALSKFRGVMNQLSVLTSFVGDKNICRNDFIKLAMQEMKGYGGRLISDKEFIVSFLPYSYGMPREYPITLIPDVMDGSIPRFGRDRMFFEGYDTLSPSPDGIIEEIFPNVDVLMAYEAYEFDKVLSKTTECCYLMRSITDESGRETNPSPFLTDKFTAHDFPPVAFYPNSFDDGNFLERIKMISNIENKRIFEAEEFKKYYGYISDAKAREVIRDKFSNRPMSASGVGRYAACPFLFFAEKVLGLEPKEEDTPDMARNDLGTIIHSVFEIFYSSYGDSVFDSVPHNEIVDNMDGIIDGIIDDVKKKHCDLFAKVNIALMPSYIQRIKRLVVQVINFEIEASKNVERKLIPYKFEWGFGYNGVSPLVLEIEGDVPAQFHGLIDRIDVDESKKIFLVLDYKTGSESSNKSLFKEMKDGINFQLPLYVEAVKELLFSDAEPLGGLIINVPSAKKERGFVKKDYNGIYYDVGRLKTALSYDAYDELVSSSLSMCLDTVKRIRSGIFSPALSKKCFTNCEYADACRFSKSDND